MHDTQVFLLRPGVIKQHKTPPHTDAVRVLHVLCKLSMRDTAVFFMKLLLYFLIASQIT